MKFQKKNQKNKTGQNQSVLRKNTQKIINSIGPDGRIPTDVLGSYTGQRPDGEIPEQDADDL